jgi:hypothetical protein
VSAKKEPRPKKTAEEKANLKQTKKEESKEGNGPSKVKDHKKAGSSSNNNNKSKNNNKDGKQQ